ncbi:MAG: AMP-binding protein [Woeseiaceae bacterium]
MMIAGENDRTEAYRKLGWWPGVRLAEHYHHHVIAHPDALALADSTGRELTHAELWQRSGELAESLRKQGIESRDVVLLFLPNRVEWQIAMLAVLRLDAVPASIATKTDSSTLAYAAQLVCSDLILTARTEHGDDLIGIAGEAASAAARDLGILCVSVDGEHQWVSEPKNRHAKSISGLDHIMFTSSTTGMPKAVMHSADTLAALNILFTERFSLETEAPIFMGSPLGHSVGGIHGARLALHTGAALILQETWEPSAAMALIEKYGCAFTAAATPFLKDLLDDASRAGKPRHSSLKSFLCGGAPVPPALLEKAWRLFPDTFVTNLWGMTEGGLVTCVPESPKDKLIETAGIGLPGLELRVIGEHGETLASGEEGELAMRGPGVCIGYCGQDDLYQSFLTPDGFFRTGDLARIDDEGYVRITGRLKDLIIRGGVNISPLAAEDILASHPGVRSVAVIGFPDDRLGERICAVIVPTEEKPSLGDLIRYASDEGLPKRNLPEVIRYVDAMPRTAAGKIRKPDLQKLINRADPDQLDLEVENVS